MQKYSNNFLTYFITILILVITDSVILVGYLWFKALVAVFLLVVFTVQKKRMDKELFIVYLIVVFIITIQALRWDMYFSSFVGYFVIALLLPYMAIKIIGIGFLKAFQKIMVFVSIISIILYLGQIFLPGFTNLLMKGAMVFQPFNSVPERPSIFIYSIATNTVDQGSMSSFLRNPGPFHEPGAFATFLVLAISINLIVNDKPFNIKNIVLLVALVTTFSTAGFVSGFLVYLFYFYRIKTANPVYLVLISILIIPTSIYVFSLPFMADKLENRVNSQMNISINAGTSGRILGARKALIVLSRYPLFGRGLSKGSKVKDKSSDEAAGYGFSLFFSTLGIPFSLAFIYFFIRALKRISFYFSGDQAKWGLIGIGLLVNLFSQKFITDSFFIMFFFVGVLKEFRLTYQNNYIYAK